MRMELWAAIYIQLFVLLLGCSVLQAKEFCICTQAVDGDTLKIQRLGESKNGNPVYHVVRFKKHDSPELKQKCGEWAKDMVAKQCVGQFMYLDLDERDIYGRYLEDPFDGRVSHNMIAMGAAWASDDATEADKRAQERARDKNLGLWHEPKPIKPSEWRKKNKRRKA